MNPTKLTNWMKKAMQALMCGMILLTSSMPVGVQADNGDPVVEPETKSFDLSSMETHMGYPYAQDLADKNTVEILDDLVDDAAAKPQLVMEAEPQILFADTPVTLSWELQNPGTYKELTTEIILPKGLTLKGGTLLETYTGREEEDDEQSRYQIDKEATKGSLELYVSDLTLAPFMVELQLKEGKEVLYGESVFLNEAQYTMSAGKSETVVTANGKVTIASPSKGISSDLVFDVRHPSPNHSPGISLSGNPIEIIAADPNNKSDVKQFEESFTLTMTYDEERLMGMNENDLSLFYYDEETQDWWPIETTVDPKTNQLTAQVDHLTVFDYQANSWQGATLPSVDAFQVDGFTGAGTYSVELWTPPGPGGFQPTLNLNYNSQIIDDSTAFVQASWVGMGWSLDTGYIQRDMHGTNETLTDDTFVISVGGVSSRLLPISSSGTVTSYATSDRSYMTIEYDSSTETWTVWDNTGMKYVFDHTTTTDASSGCATSANDLDLVWRWSLTEANNIFGQTIDYAYSNESKGGSSSCLNQLAVYPTTITYPNDQYRIHFTLENRTDYQSAWSANAAKTLFAKQLLDSIEVQQYNGSSWDDIRVYELSYDSTSAGRIYENFQWSAGGSTNTLASIQEKNGAESSALPAITFTYGDDLHLTKVENGYGGTVEMTYERKTYMDDFSEDPRSYSMDFGVDSECDGGVPNDTTWYKVSIPGQTGSTGTVMCDGNGDSLLQLDERYDNLIVGGNGFPAHILKPGGEYRMYIRVRAIGGTAYGRSMNSTDVLFGFYDSAYGSDVELFLDNIGTTMTEGEGNYDMPVDMNPSNTKLIIECNYCYVDKLRYMLLPLYYRVTERTVTDEVTGEESVYTYNYDEPASNDALHSAIVNTEGEDAETLYTNAFRDFRGYAVVKTKNPDHLSTTTWYHQSDGLKGKPYFTLTAEQAYYSGFVPNSNGQLSSSDVGSWTYNGGGANTSAHSSDMMINDGAMKNVNPDADWDVAVNRSLSSVTAGDVVYADFMVDDGTSTRSKLYMATSDQSRIGLYAYPAGSGHALSLLSKYKTNGETTSDVLFSDSVFKEETFYTAMFFIMENGINVRVWEKGDPDNFAERTVSQMEGNLTWGLTQDVYQGTAWLDNVFEGEVLQDVRTIYDATVQYDSQSGGATDIANTNLVTDYEDLSVTWGTPDTVYTRTYGGDDEFETTKVEYTYESTYGNLTEASTAWWDGSGWNDFVKTKTSYATNASAHLTHLPAREIVLDCESATCNISTEVGKITETLYLYDGSASYTSTPTNGKLTATRAWVGGSDYVQSTMAYDSYGNITSSTRYTGYATLSANPTSGGQSTTTSYDSTYHTYPLTVTNALSQSVSTAYDYSLGLPTSVTDANGNVTSASYDDFGRMTKVAAPGDDLVNSPTLQIFYHDYVASTQSPYHVNLLQKVDAGGSIRISHFYDGLGREIQTQNVGAIVEGTQKTTVVDVDYDDAGNLVEQTVPYEITYNGTPTFTSQTFAQSSTEHVYDAFGRLTSTTAPNGNETEYSYDGFSVTMTDARNNATSTEYDVWGRTVLVDEVTGPDVAYDYDVLGRLVEAIRNNLVTEITYDQLGRKTALDDPDMGEWYYSYDGAGNLLTQTDAKNCITTLSYDNLNRLTGKTYSGTGCGTTPAVTYTYDSTANGNEGIGRRTAMSDGSGSTAWKYDTRGRLIKEDKTIGSEVFTTEYTYNSADLPVTMTYPDGSSEELTYDYDGAGNLFNITNDDTTAYTYLDKLEYDEAGRVTTIELGNSGTNAILSQDFSYHSWSATTYGGLLSRSLVTVNSTSTTLLDLNYNSYDANGNVLEIEEDVDDETSSFTYDALNRITGMTVVDGSLTTLHSESFAYNASSGSHSSKTMNAITSTLTYGDTNHPHAVTGYEGNSYSYDANGNQTLREIEDDDYALVYDHENRLTGVTRTTPQPTATATPTPTNTNTATNTATFTNTPSGTVTNVALGKTATQCDTYGTAYASLAVDGNTDGDYYNGSVSNTGAYTNAWWEVDLGAIYDISSIKVWNRTDCCGWRLENFYLFISDVPFTSTDLTTTLNQSGVTSYYSSSRPLSPSEYTFTNTTGRYVRIQLPYRDYLHMAEFEVMGVLAAGGTPTNTPTATKTSTITNTPTNVALNKMASQITTQEVAYASKAVDGNTDGNYANGSVSMTEKNSEAWWEVDLGSSYTISSIKLYNVTSCCEWYLDDFYILISDNPFTSYDLTTTINQSGVTSYYSDSRAERPSEYTFTNTTGRYVRVQLENTNYLQIAEIEVIGVPNGPILTPTVTQTPTNTTVPSITPTPTDEPLTGNPYNVSLGKSASQSSLQELAYASLAVDGNTDGDFANGSVAMTEINSEAWWEVDLGASYNISSVKIYNVSSCCSWYFDDFYILISDSPFTSTDLTTTINQSGVTSYFSDTRPNRPSEYTFTNTTGRYVRIQLSGSNHLQIAEIEVMGILVGTPTATPLPTATPTATTEATSSGMKSWGGILARPARQDPTPTEDPQALPDDFSSASYTYDGDDNLVKSVIDGVTTYYVGGYYELVVEGTDETEVKYYYAASRRIAMRTVTSTTDTLYWLISDHLSSTSIVTDESGTIVSEMKYTAFGEIREMNGSSPTDYESKHSFDFKANAFCIRSYTGQRKEVEFGLSYYNARWLDSSTGHFISADTLIPESKRCFDLGRICDANSPIAARCVGVTGNWDRYAYVLNNPLKYIDPTGHGKYSGDDDYDPGYNNLPIASIYKGSDFKNDIEKGQYNSTGIHKDRCYTTKEKIYSILISSYPPAPALDEPADTTIYWAATFDPRSGSYQYQETNVPPAVSGMEVLVGAAVDTLEYFGSRCYYQGCPLLNIDRAPDDFQVFEINSVNGKNGQKELLGILILNTSNVKVVSAISSNEMNPNYLKSPNTYPGYSLAVYDLSILPPQVGSVYLPAKQLQTDREFFSMFLTYQYQFYENFWIPMESIQLYP